MLSCVCVLCIVFAFQLIRAKELRIYIEVKESEEKCDVMASVAMFLRIIARCTSTINSGFSVALWLKTESRCIGPTTLGPYYGGQPRKDIRGQLGKHCKNFPSHPCSKEPLLEVDR